MRDRPRLDVRQVGFYNAYQRVTGSRNVSMSGPLPIPVSEIKAYCNLYKIHDVEKVELLHDMITCLDRVYLEHAAEMVKSKK